MDFSPFESHCYYFMVRMSKLELLRNDGTRDSAQKYLRKFSNTTVFALSSRQPIHKSITLGGAIMSQDNH